MIIYNVTVNIDNSVHDEWLQWMRQVHIPDVMRTGYFVSNRILKVMADEESGGVTYSIQYTCKTMNDFLEYEHTLAPNLRQQHALRYKDKFVAFRTLLEEI
jgi:hypothetical protein